MNRFFLALKGSELMNCIILQMKAKLLIMAKGEKMEKKSMNAHPLDVLDEKAIKTAYTISKVFFVILALCAIAGGIAMCVLSKQEVVGRYYNHYETNAGMLAGGIITMVLGPFLIWVAWLFTRLIFMLFHDVSIIRKNITGQSDQRNARR